MAKIITSMGYYTKLALTPKDFSALCEIIERSTSVSVETLKINGEYQYFNVVADTPNIQGELARSSIISREAFEAMREPKVEEVEA